MDSLFSASELAFRDELRRFFRSAVPDGMRRKVRLGQNLSAQEMRDWHRILDAKGWAAPAWDAAWGGTGWNPMQIHMYREELHMAYAPTPFAINISLAGPLIIAFGSDEQKARFLPGIKNLDYWFAQGFSEPDAGSDLASLRTHAVQDGDSYVVTGQKAWTTLAQHANWMFTLVRTSSEGRKQDGLTFLLIDMSSPGVTVRPVISIDRDHHVNEVFLDNVRVPVANRVGEEGRAWSYTKYLLTQERVIGARAAMTKLKIAKIKEAAAKLMENGVPLSDRPWLQSRLAALEVELTALEITTIRVLAEMQSRAGDTFDPKSSMLKLKGSELYQRADELLVDVLGPLGLPYTPGFLQGEDDAEALVPEWARTAMQKYFLNRATTIYAGSAEVQHNILAKAILAL